MDDKLQVLKLYEKMNRINIYLKDLEEKINLLKEELDTTFKIDDKTVLEDEILKENNTVKNSKLTIRNNIMNDLINYL